MILVSCLFLFFYLLIAVEGALRFHRTAAALLAGVATWSAWVLGHGGIAAWADLNEQLRGASQVVFFLMGAMAIVGLVDAHDGFAPIRRLIQTRDPLRLFWFVGLVAFFLSPILDNLTAAIVMMTLTRGLVKDPGQRRLFAAAIITAVNAGGAWSPIGDVTTTMLWIGGQVGAIEIIRSVFLPSFAMFLAVQSILMIPILRTRKSVPLPAAPTDQDIAGPRFESVGVLIAGFAALLAAPIGKTVFHMPPWFGMLAGLGVLWVFTSLLHRKKSREDRERLSVERVLGNLDVPTLLFFLGILVAVGALEASLALQSAQMALDRWVAHPLHLAAALGVASSLIDNVPLVAAAQHMYPLERFAANHPFWKMLALTTGTGGSLLVIGSAAGVALMGMERLRFGWYLVRVTPAVMAGYLAGVGVYLLTG